MQRKSTIKRGSVSENEAIITDLSNSTDLSDQFLRIRELLNDENFSEAKELLISIHPADLADFIDSSSLEMSAIIFELLENEIKPETIAELSPKSIQISAKIYSDDHLADLLKELSSDEALDYIIEIDESRKEGILSRIPKDKRNEILDSYNYPEETAGRVMSRKFVKFSEFWSVGQAIDSIRGSDQQFNEDFHAAVIVNTKNKPVGTINLYTLLKYPRNTSLKEIMNYEFKLVSPETELEDISYYFKQYALSVMPVVSKTGKIVGTLSIDNMVYIIDEQAEDAFLNLGGVFETDLYSTFTTAAKHRFPWLFINLIAAYLTSLIINNFGDIIVKMVALASLMPVVASLGGNAATQTMAVTLIAITNKEIDKMNSFRIIFKEFLTCAFNGAVFSLIGGLVVVGIFEDILLAKVFSLAVFINFILAGILGSSIPIFLNKMNLDPAVSSGVILCAFTDSLGFLTFLGLAKYIINF